MTDDVTVIVGGATLAGWLDVRITRRIEGCPNDFDLAVTERFPGQADAFVIQAGQSCVVKIGADTVVTGYVDKYHRSFDKASHAVSISGRGKCQDLVDCSAEWPGGQISGANVQDVADILALPYAIETVALGENLGPKIPQINLLVGETAYDVIEKLCRFAGLLAYENEYGDLVLANGQDTPAASGFTQGVNVQAASVTSSTDQRFSEYDFFLNSFDEFTALGGTSGNLLAKVPDPNVRRNRKLFQVAEATTGGQDIAKLRALWEAARRAARSFVVQVTCDSWRDAGGNLWIPNTLAPISLPGLKMQDKSLLIGEVVYRRGVGGTTADITLMDPDAFQPQPQLLLPTFPGIR